PLPSVIILHTCVAYLCCRPRPADAIYSEHCDALGSTRVRSLCDPQGPGAYVPRHADPLTSPTIRDPARRIRISHAAVPPAESKVAFPASSRRVSLSYLRQSTHSIR